jgi:hypothetical protein
MSNFQEQIEEKNNKLEKLKNNFISFLYPDLNINCDVVLAYISDIDKTCHIDFIQKNQNEHKKNVIFKLYINYYKEENIEYNYNHSNRYNEIKNDDLLTMSTICLKTQSIKDNLSVIDINNYHRQYIEDEKNIKKEIEQIKLNLSIYLENIKSSNIENIKKILQPLTELQKNEIKQTISKAEGEVSIPILILSIQGDSFSFKNSHIKIKNKKRKLIYLNDEHISKSYLNEILSKGISIKGKVVERTYELNSILDMRNAISFNIGIDELFKKLKTGISVINF